MPARVAMTEARPASLLALPETEEVVTPYPPPAETSRPRPPSFPQRALYAHAGAERGARVSLRAR